MATSALLMIPAAVDRFGARVHGVPAHRWNDPTPCTEWSVSDLVNHLIGEHLWAPHILARETIAQVGDRFDGDLTDGDPAKAWDLAAASSLAAFQATDGSGTVHLSFGEVPLAEYAAQMLVDLTIHQWDLARGSGQDETLDPEAVAFSLAYAHANIDTFAGMGIVAPPVPTTSKDPVVQLISLTGRHF
ncbi:TIGR03086 family metal-binding protein [Catenuloplanes japonicus]|uniref:TIGR03086 family metal-binding protein n=1 Tax=Catenuloplanes japonicus TaxID=33876 RepID=UPI0005251AC3|nr:TIGR03086 family metal-binding protein [Catenuloplanes japonicus]